MANRTGKSITDEAKRRHGTDQPVRMKPDTPVYGTDLLEKPPASLRGKRRHQAKWKALVPILKRQGVAKNTDVDLLVIYIDAWVRYEDADKAFQDIGTDDWRQRRNMRLELKDARDAVFKAADRLGLSPLTRQRIEATPDIETPGGRLAELRRIK